MNWKNYNDVESIIKDDNLIKVLCKDKTYDEVVKEFLQEDFVELDPGARVPFFAETRGYKGAREKSTGERWIMKPVEGDEILNTEMSAIVFFLDFFTNTISAPTSITLVEGVPHRVSKLILKSEQLSGANYMEQPPLKEQLALDLINRWIYCDEDRNPNNYMIRYNDRNEPVVISIDFSNVDLWSEAIKIKGMDDHFSWERKEKTRYLTPLKNDTFIEYDMRFFNQRFDGFKKITGKQIEDLCERVFSFGSGNEKHTSAIRDHLLERVQYVYSYFSKHIPIEKKEDEGKKYDRMGSTFRNMYGG